ncbi:MAG: phospho-sugar mutase [Myxococcaceae bacterium]|nr:phospho-sugar mutase [Myxococcaceae bacterium]
MDATEVRRRAEAWRQADPDPQTAAELTELLERNDVDALADRFAGSLEFGTAGLRGVIGAGPNRMNRAVVRRTTAGLARYLRQHVPDVAQRGVVVGRDGRRMSREFAEDVACVLAAEGIPALVFPDVSPTPLTAFAVLQQKAAAAVMVTASHNPPEYNGYKVYWENGAQIIPPHDKGIAAEIDRVEPANRVRLLSPEEAKAKGLWRELGPKVGEAYLRAILAERRNPGAAPELRIVYTAMHGVGGRWVEEAFSRAGFRHLGKVAAQHEPDGAFPTVRFPNPEEPGAMDLALAQAEREGAELVLANDPDADRLAAGVRDLNGGLRMLSGNEVGVLLGHYLLTQTQPPPERPLVVTTIVSSPQLGEIARDLGALYDEQLTGFKWIANAALRREQDGARFVFGYEEALGYTIGRVVRDKDGIGAALVFADLAGWCKSRGTTVLGYLEEIQRRHGLFVAKQVNFTFKGAEGAQTIARIMDGFRAAPPKAIGALEVKNALDYREGARGLPSSNVIAYELEGGSRITLRPSGTEPKIKYYFDLKEPVASGEAMETARARALERLEACVQAFLALAKERGQPA